MSDCAPLVYAQEAGLFGNYGLEVELRRENSWLQSTDKVIQGELDGAHVPATLPFLANLGLSSEPGACACVTGLVLSLQGNAIVISRQLWDEGVRSGEGLRDRVYSSWGRRIYTFGVVFSFSPQELLLRQWLRSAAIPEAAVRLVAVPPVQMFPTLKLGYLDGYCVCEPWISIAVEAGVGVCIATSADLAPLHPEKVLMVRQTFADQRHHEHERLLAALLEACVFCDQPQNRPLVSELLADPQYVDAPAECVRAGLVGPLPLGEHQSASLLSLAIFHRFQANEPSAEKAQWLVQGLRRLVRERMPQARNPADVPILTSTFRPQIFEQAKAVMRQRTGFTRLPVASS